MTSSERIGLIMTTLNELSGRYWQSHVGDYEELGDIVYQLMGAVGRLASVVRDVGEERA